MVDPTASNPPAASLVIVINGQSTATPQELGVPLRYASAAAAMDLPVEVHAVGPSVAWLRRDAIDAGLLTRIRVAVEFGVDFFVCPQAMAEHGLGLDDLIDEAHEVRGAASLLGAALAPGARLLSF